MRLYGGVYRGLFIWVIKEDTISLDYGSCGLTQATEKETRSPNNQNCTQGYPKTSIPIASSFYPHSKFFKGDTAGPGVRKGCGENERAACWWLCEP